MRTMLSVAFLVAVSAAAGCVSEETARYQGVTTGAGEAIAANTVLQMVDPWQRGVEDTDLAVPADRDARRAVGSDGTPATTTNISTTSH